MSSPVSLVDAATGSSGATLVGTEVGDRVGVAVAPAGDFNGDGIADFLVGAVPSPIR